ncbi:arsenate reductase family protein [Sulfurimonas sp. SAG-AH-194-I05]|nr:arsenate reductase family protein [Sulfurimonas sp. SAG-AH-194-I05]MDF1874533.1 arsenate reductase family protein [Sulfurimonas sp. SAG-AH-194-I05]
MITLYGIKNCDSVKKAITFFKKHNLQYTLYDFKEKAVGIHMVESWLEKTDLKTLFNARSTTYRTLKLKEMDLDDAQKVQYLAKENMLIKRPVVTFEEHLLVGFKEENFQKIFL